MVVEYVLQDITGENKLVKKFKDRYMVSLYSPKERMELGSFRNQLLHHFVDEGIMCCALYTCEKESRKDRYMVLMHTDAHSILTCLLALPF